MAKITDEYYSFLKDLAQEYISTLDGVDKDEIYTTAKGFAEGALFGQFLPWLYRQTPQGKNRLNRVKALKLEIKRLQKELDEAQIL